MCRRPRRIGDEMLKGLIGAGIVHALEHRAHRLATTVAQQAEQIASESAALCHVAELALERLEPCRQAVQPGRRIPWQQHRAAAYRKCVNRTMSSHQIIDVSLAEWAI
jgi:hypothetical protein